MGRAVDCAVDITMRVLSQDCSCLTSIGTQLAGTAVGSCCELLSLLLCNNRICLGLLYHRLNHTLLLRREVRGQAGVELRLFLLQP